MNLDAEKSETTYAIAETARWRFDVRIVVAAMLFGVACSVEQPFPSETPSAICDNIFTYGGDASDRAYAVATRPDGELVVTGFTSSFGAGGHDLLLLRVGADGNLSSANQYGGDGDDWGKGLIVVEDDSIVVVGGTKSNSLGSWDLWLLEVDSAGDTVWSRTFGGADEDWGEAVAQAENGDFIAVGYTDSGGHGRRDAFAVRTNSQGDEVFSTTFGGVNDDVASDLIVTDDGGWVFIGFTESSGAGERDFWLVKVDADGEQQWQRTFGGQANDVGSAIASTGDGGFALVGYTESYGAGDDDLWVIRTNADGEEIFSTTVGGVEPDVGRDVLIAEDGGIVVSGWTLSFGSHYFESWLIKLDSQGSIVWRSEFGGSNRDYAMSVEADSNGYVITGSTESCDAYGDCGAYPCPDVWLVWLDQEGHVR